MNKTFSAEFRFHDPDAEINPSTHHSPIGARNLSAAQKIARDFAKRNGWRFIQCRETTKSAP